MTLRSTIAALGLALCVATLAPFPARAQTGTVEGVEVQGLVRMSNEAFLRAFGIRAGDPYEPARIRAAYKRAWDLGLFDDLSIEAEDGAGGGKVLIIRAKERRVLTGITYEDNKVLTRTSIEDRLREKKVSLDVGKPLNLRTIFDAQQEIRLLLGEKGYLDPAVRYTLAEPTTSTATVRFEIRPGAKTRIREIEFVGNTIYSDRKMLKQLKLTQEWRWWWPLSQKNLYHPAKWDQDTGGIRDLYLNTGYLDVELRPPVVEVREKGRDAGKTAADVAAQAPAPEPASEPPKPDTAPISPDDLKPQSERQIRKRAERERKEAEKALKRAEKDVKKKEPKVKRWAYLTVPVVEGKQYKSGEITVTGNTVYSEDDIKKRMVFLRPGLVFNNGLLDLSIQSIQRQYQDKGYAYATARREITRRPGDDPVADVKIIVTEDKQYTVDRIEFAGNSATQDRVLRREFRLAEGDLFSQSLLDLSVNKVNQLGYFEAKREDVTVTPVEGKDKVRVTVPGEEKGRNEVQVGGGYSGLDGAFFTGYYSTRNLLGRGQVFSASVQVGGNANRYQIAFQEPYFLGRPWSAGFSLFRRDIDYNSTQSSSGSGFGIALGRLLGNFSSVGARYDFERVRTKGFNFSTTVAENEISSFTPTFAYNRINNPYRPSAGWQFSADMQVAGGPLGGDTNYLRPRLNYTGFKRGPRRTFFGLHAEAGQIKAWQGGAAPSSSNINGVPRFERFWLGGDTTGPRVFETRAVAPLRYIRFDPSRQYVVEVTDDPSNRPTSDFDLTLDGVVDERDLVDVGGDRYYLAQLEYVIPFSGQSPVEAAVFLDVGNALMEDQPWGFDDVRAAWGVEVRFYIPVFPVPLRLIYGAPIRKLPQDRTSAFTFSIGRSF
ncbi:MAG TPA: outer membrane protein assembly factor BamA [Candidatus Polarisedimenticolaceae bacterium]